MHNWEPGNYGKGITDQNGVVHTWNEDEYPFHHNYISAHPQVGDPRAFFYIAPEGNVRTTYPNRRYDDPHVCDAEMANILKVDPHFTEHQPSSDWDF